MLTNLFSVIGGLFFVVLSFFGFHQGIPSVKTAEILPCGSNIHDSEYPFHYCTKATGVYSIGLNGLSLISGADPKSFVFIKDPPSIGRYTNTYELSKDKNHVYYENDFANTEVLPDADPSTFKFIGMIGGGNLIVGDKNNIYYWVNYLSNKQGDENHLNFVQLVGADGGTFSLLRDASGQVSYYAKDKNHVYFSEQHPNDTVDNAIRIVTGADLKTFTAILPQNVSTNRYQYDQSLFARDNQHLFLSGLIVPGADPNSISQINGYASCKSCGFFNTDYLRDHSHVYLETNTQDGTPTLLPIKDADPATFSVIVWTLTTKDISDLTPNADFFSPYDKDATHVWYFDGSADGWPIDQISGADPTSFTKVGMIGSDEQGYDFYAKDKNHVYYDENLLLSADPATFILKVTNNSDAQDKNHTYFKGVIVQ